MLNSLYVKNLALIEETEVEFAPGLNILTGETGAGKSIIIGSINLALGEKADKDMIRTGKDYALVELTFSLDNDVQREKCRELEFEAEDDSLVISRKISVGKSTCRVNGETVSAKQLKELAEVLLDVYGQHEHQSLTSKKKQAEILDDFCGEELACIKEELSTAYKAYKELEKEWESADRDETVRRKEIAFLEFELQEIEDADIKPGEDEETEAQFRKMANAKRILEGLSAIVNLLGNTAGESISEMIGRALREIKSISSYDDKLGEYEQLLFQIEELTTEARRGLSSYEEDMYFAPEEFDQTSQRLDLINHLKSKYGNTIEEIYSYREKQQKQLERLQNYDTYLNTLQRQLSDALLTVKELCEKAFLIRQRQAEVLSAKMAEALRDLNFMEVNFCMEIQKNENAVSANGYDEIEFMLSTNPGEPMKPLANIASGGELSRIMLGLKTVMAQKDGVNALIFDEIDAGISGKTAWQVSKKLAYLGAGHQVICITHLPQIAAMADCHFKIEKRQEDSVTKTHIFRLEDEESVLELARLLGGEELTEGAVINAKEMKNLALEAKQY